MHDLGTISLTLGWSGQPTNVAIAKEPQIFGVGQHDRRTNVPAKPPRAACPSESVGSARLTTAILLSALAPPGVVTTAFRTKWKGRALWNGLDRKYKVGTLSGVLFGGKGVVGVGFVRAAWCGSGAMTVSSGGGWGGFIPKPYSPQSVPLFSTLREHLARQEVWTLGGGRMAARMALGTACSWASIFAWASA